MPIDMTKITKEMVAKALECKTADELIALAKTYGFTLTKEEAEAYLAEFEDMELDSAALEKVAGGSCNKVTIWGTDGCDKNEHLCFAGDSQVAVPGGVKCIKDLQLGDKVITLNASGKEIIGVVTEVMQPAEEEIVEVAFSDGTLWHTTESQTLYLAHNQHCMVKFAKGKKALLRNGGTTTVTDVRYTGKRETVYDVLVGEDGDENVFFVSGIATEGYFTQRERELLKKARECKTADEVMSLAKANGITITKEEAELYIA